MGWGRGGLSWRGRAKAGPVGRAGRPGLLTIHNDLNVLEVDLPAGQDPALTAVSALICFLDAPDLEVVVGQDYESD